MKNLRNFLRVFCILTVALTCTNCQTDNTDELINIPKGENSYLKKGKLENYRQLSTYVEELQHKRTDLIDGKASTLEDNYGFTILYDQEMNIQEEDSYVTYSIPIYKNNQAGDTFSNLVVRFSDTEPTEAFILDYKPDSEYLDAVAIDEQTPFAGSISSQSMDYDGSLDALKEDGGCITVTTKYCDFDEGEHGDTHLGGDNCTVGFYWFVTTTYCFGDEPTLVDIPTPGSGSPSASDYVDYATAGGGISNDGGTVHPPITVPNVPNTYTGLDIDGLTLTMVEWLNSSENREFKKAMEMFLAEEDPLTRNELEAFLMVTSESSDEPWVNSSGYFNNVPNLEYTQLRHMAEGYYIYTEFKLLNGDIIMRGDFSETSELLPLTFYYSKEIKRLFEIPEPLIENPSINLDFLWNNFWSTVQTGMRYFTPMEDIKILIDGTDFDGVESSEAVSGIFILIDIVPVGKVIKIVKKAGQVITNSVPVIRRIIGNIYKTQRRLVKKYKGIIATSSNIRKGNWSEMATDVDLIGKGYKELHIDRLTDIDAATHQGIDHIFKNPTTGGYIIVETKYTGSASLNTLADGTRQMSDTWIEGGNRLLNALDNNATLAQEILSSNYQRVLAKVKPDGTIVYRLLNSDGYIILGNAGNFTP